MEIKIPEVGESVFEALLARWLKHDGDRVRKDEPLCEIETDKITFEITAEVDGVVRVAVAEGATVKIGAVIGSIDAETQAEVPATPPKVPGPALSPPAVSPAVRKIAREQGLEPESISGSGKGGRVTVDDLYGRFAKGSDVAAGVDEVNQPVPVAVRSEEPAAYVAGTDGRVTRKIMTPIRKRIAERLLAARQQTAMLTTFNEADMSRVVALRGKHRDDFLKRHGVALGFMSFFVKATVEALREFPVINARIEGDEIVYQHFYDIGIAVSAEKGLVVPVLRDADRLPFAAIETAITDFVDRVKTNRLAIADLEGGTFTISNGGIFGSLLSTPIVNPPQAAVLGMHAIQERPVARDGQVVIRPMMYLALSYDHRLIDGREAVQFLKRLKEFIEEPEELLLEG